MHALGVGCQLARELEKQAELVGRSTPQTPAAKDEWTHSQPRSWFGTTSDSLLVYTNICTHGINIYFRIRFKLILM